MSLTIWTLSAPSRSLPNRIPLRSLRVKMVSVWHVAHVSVQTFLGNYALTLNYGAFEA